MAIREYQFTTGIETSVSPDPATPSADYDTLSKGYGDDTYSKASSWYDKQANITAIKGVAAADRSDGQIVFNYGTDSFYRFNSASSATGDDDLVLTPSVGSGRWIKISSGSSAGGGDTLVQQLDTSVAGITAGEAISNRDACCLILHNGTGSDVFRVFKTDADFGNKNSFAGFSKSAGTVTPQISTYTISAAYVSGNVIPISINTRLYSVTYASSSDATLQALATLIATDQDVQSAIVTVVGGNQTGTDDRVITITSKGGLSLVLAGTTVTSGASQPSITLLNTQAAAGDTIDLHQFGPLTGFSGLTTGARYFLSSTSGALTTTYTSTADVYVGQALSSTILFVNPNKFDFAFQPGTGLMLYTSGFAARGDGSAPLTATEHFTFSTWSNGTALPAARSGGSTSDAGMKGYLYVVDGGTANVGAGNATSLKNYSYNNTSWTTGSDRSTARCRFATAVYSGSMFFMKGSTAQSYTNGSNGLDSFNGSTWANAVNTFSTATSGCSGFGYNSKVIVCGGTTTAGTNSQGVETWNGASVSTETNIPGSGYETAGGLAMLAFAYIHTDGTDSFKFTGTTWSSTYTTATVTNSREAIATGPSSGFNSATGKAYFVGGTNGAGAAIATTFSFDGTTVASSTSASNAKTGPAGGMN